MKNNFYALIMAGGVGSRFWPTSTQEFPKQFHDILGTGNTLIQQTFKRIEQSVSSENIFIATNKRYEKLVLSQLAKVDKTQLLLEPEMRNTAPCILYAALKIYKKNKNAILLVAPSDHWIDDENLYTKNIQTAYNYCTENDVLMTLGIQPNSPNTGYGYIQFNQEDSTIKKVKKFTEKPNLKTAEQFLSSGDYLWNAGIFVWSAKSIIRAFEKFLPQMHTLFNEGASYLNTPSEIDFIAKNYKRAENISIDFGILERADNVWVLPVDFGWNDLGTWSSLHQKLQKDTDNNAVTGGRVLFKEAHGNIIKTQSKKRVIIQGLDDYIVVEKDDILLICPKTAEQDIKDIALAVKTKFGEDYI